MINNIDSIYIHIPFCSKKCNYCDFWVFINMEQEYENYVEYLVKEIKLYPDYKYKTVYIGGGTPSLLSISDIKKIMDTFDNKQIIETTIEVNPNDVTYDKLEKYLSLGINRLSIGIQTFNNKHLHTLGRNHNENEAIKMYKDARKAGFSNISIDLIFAIPNQTLEELKLDLQKIINLNPEHISIYSLIWESGTMFWHERNKGNICEVDEDLEATMYEYIIDTLTKNGYTHYEISNFCKPSYEAKHNSAYWENNEFVGIGLNSSSYYNNRRYSNKKNIYKYYEDIENKIRPINKEKIEYIDEIEKEKMRKILGLRLLKKGIKVDLRDSVISKMISNELLEISKNNKIVLSKKGLMLSNDVFVELI